MANRPRPRTGASTEVTVDRVPAGRTFVRVSTIGVHGERPFVLVPGIGVSSTYFERLAPNLNEFGPVHALDLPGFGGVPHPGRALTIREYADLVGKVIDEYGLTDPVIVGHSMGTQIVTDLVARRPDISTMVLIGPVVNPAERRVGLQAIRFLQAAWHEPLQVKVLAVSAYLLCGFHWFFQILPKMMRFPLERALPHVRAATLVIRGEFDAVCPSDWATRVGELLPRSRTWEMPGAGHSVMYAHAEEVAVLCVEHARQGMGQHDDDELQHYDIHADLVPDETPRATPRQLWHAARGRVRAAVGTVTRDDRLIAAGKTEHARAINAIHAAERDGVRRTQDGEGPPARRASGD